MAELKITADHLKRDAYLYVRQSTLRQVAENGETKTKSVVTSKAATTSRQNSADPSKAAGSKGAKPGVAAASASPKAVVKAEVAKLSGVVNVARRHPVTTAALSLLATAMLLAAGVYLLQTQRSASANDRNDGVKLPAKSSATEVAKTK